MVYVVLPMPFDISPVLGFMVSPLPGTGLKINVPPEVPVITAELLSPSQKSVVVKPASSTGETITVSFIVNVAGHTGVVVVKVYSTPSNQVAPLFLVNTKVFVDWPVTNVICCETPFGPALKFCVFVPSLISILPLLLFLAMDIVIEVPAGTVWSKISVKMLFALLIRAEFVLFRVVPVAKITPVELLGSTPPVALIPFPERVTEPPPDETSVKLIVVFATMPVIVTVAFPEASKTTVWSAPPFIL